MDWQVRMQANKAIEERNAGRCQKDLEGDITSDVESFLSIDNEELDLLITQSQIFENTKNALPNATIAYVTSYNVMSVY